MLDSLTLTQGLAALIGLYFLAAGVGLLCERERLGQMFQELKAQPMLGYLGAVVAFAIGGAIVSVHNDWSTWLSSFVSLMGWGALLEGTLLLAARTWFLELFEGVLTSDGFLKAISYATIAAGIVLLWCALS